MVTRVRPDTPARLLLIDEIEADRSLASVVLSQAFPDCDLQEVSDGADLFGALKSGTFDLVVTELGVREASWAFVLDAIRAMQPQASIVAFSSPADRDTQLEILDAGATAFVAKSTQGYLDLKRAVGKVLGYEAEEQDHSGTRSGAPSVPWEAVPEAGPARDDGWVEMQPDGRASGVYRRPNFDPLPAADPDPPSEIETYVDEDDSAQLPVPMATFVGQAHQLLSGPLRQALAVLASVIAVSALISFLVSRATSEVSAKARTESETTGVVLGAHATANDEEPALESRPAEVPPAGPPSIEQAPTVATSQPAPLPVAPNKFAPSPPFRGTMPVTLEIRATDEVWVLVTLDGKDVLDATLQPGAIHVFQGQAVAGLRVGNAAGLQVFWNGKDIGRMGREGQVRRLYFTPNDVGAGAPPDPATLARP